MTIQKNFLFTVRGNTKTKLLTPSRAKFSFDKKLQFCKIQWIDPLLHHKISALLATGKLFCSLGAHKLSHLLSWIKNMEKYNIYRYIWFPGMRFTEHWVVNNFLCISTSFRAPKAGQNSNKTGLQPVSRTCGPFWVLWEQKKNQT